MLDKKTKENFNEQRYADSPLGLPDRERVKIILELVGSGKSVLDVGCGNGEIGKLLIGNNNKVSGLDISETCVKKANKSRVTAVVCDLETEDVPFKEKFDVILAAEVIEHIVDTDVFLKKIYKSLKSDGILVLTTPNLASFGRRLLLLVNKNPHMEVSLEKYSAGHSRYFIKATLGWLLEKNGFEVVDFRSDVVNFNSSGTLRSVLLAKLVPTLGKSLILKCIKKKL
ncbi:MAG: class I SAM-dependent methyltransferase [Candidatus Paceibacterota bacterium]